MAVSAISEIKHKVRGLLECWNAHLPGGVVYTVPCITVLH